MLWGETGAAAAAPHLPLTAAVRGASRPGRGGRTKASRRGSGNRPPHPAAAFGGAGRCLPGRGERGRTNELPCGRGEPPAPPEAGREEAAAAAAALLEAKAGLFHAAFCFPEGGCRGGGGGGGAGFIPGRAAAPPLRQPAGGLEGAAPPGLRLRGAAPPLASVPGRAASSRSPLRRSWAAACWRRGQQAAASWSVCSPDCPFVSLSSLLSRTCSLSFFFDSFYLVISPSRLHFWFFWVFLLSFSFFFPYPVLFWTFFV